MRKTSKKMLVGLLSLVAIASSVALEPKAGTNQAVAESMTVSDIISANNDDWTTTYNVTEKEMNSALRCTAKGVAFVSKGTGATATKKPITIKPELSGTFEMDFRVWSDVSYNPTDHGNFANIGDGWDTATPADVRKMAITITDLDEDVAFTVWLTQGCPWNILMVNASVGYGTAGGNNWGAGRFYGSGSDDNVEKTTTKAGTGFMGSTAGTYSSYNTKLWGTSFCNTSCTTTNWSNDSYTGNNASLIGFDPVTKVVYGRQADRWGRDTVEATGYRIRTIADLSNDTDLAYVNDKLGGGKSLKDCDFNRYSVEINFTDVVPEKTAKLHITSINGQSLAGADGVLTSTTAPVAVGGKTFNTAVASSTMKVPAPVLTSLGEKNPVFNGKVKVLNSQGTEVLAETTWTDSLTFDASATDTYKVVYSGGTDATGKTYVRKDARLTTSTAVTNAPATCELPVVNAKAFGASLSLEGNVIINYYFDLADALVGAGSTAKVVFKSGSDVLDEVALASKTAVESGANAGKYKFSYPVAAKDYQKVITAVIVDGDKEIASVDYSVQSYINDVETTDEKLIAVVDSLEAYGQAASAYFAGQTVTEVADFDVANVESFAPVATKAAGSTAEDADISVSLLLKAGTEIRVYFKGELDCTVNGEAVEAVAAEKAGYYYISVEDIAASELGDEFTFVIGDYTLTYSAMSYVYAVVNTPNADADLVNLAKTLYNYYVAAYDYFN